MNINRFGWIGVLAGVAITVGAVQLPHGQAYQNVLRNYLSGLTEQDFEHGERQPFSVTLHDDIEQRYRDAMLKDRTPPILGTKRGFPTVTSPARLFLLSSIEGGEEIMRPRIRPQVSAWLATWDYVGNPYFQSRAMKMRAFVVSVIHLTILDHHLANMPDQLGPGFREYANRPDRLAPWLIDLSYTYTRVKDVLPSEIRTAFETGLRNLTRRQLDWGIQGEEIHSDMAGAVAVWYAAKALEDAAIRDESEAYIRRLMTDAACFHPAGYFLDRGGMELGFGGTAAHFANWVALAGGWPWARETIERLYRLRSHLILPEPDGGSAGPSHFNSRLDSGADQDQWQWSGTRDYAAAMLTDEAVHLIKLPTEEWMADRQQSFIQWSNHSVLENPRRRDGVYQEDDEIKAGPWFFRAWISFNYPVATVPAQVHYRDGFYAHLKALEEADSPWLKSPFERGETFVRHFGEAVTVAQRDDYAVILHTGPVGRYDPQSGLHRFEGPHGFGGGQLSAFWTPATGAVLLGRRGGMTFGRNYDSLDVWRQWPIQAVTGRKGRTEEGVDRIFTSARIIDPGVEHESTVDGTVVRVFGAIPRAQLGQGQVLHGSIDYARSFCLQDNGLTVETRVTAFGRDTIDELYETLPVFHRDQRTTAGVETVIEFQRDGVWQAAATGFQEGVTAIRLTRFNGSVLIRFDRPRRIGLAPEDFQGRYTARARNRNVLIDLLENQDRPMVLNGERVVRYTLTPDGI